MPADCGGQELNDALLAYLKAFRKAFTDDQKELRISASAMSDARKRAAEIAAKFAEAKHTADASLKAAYGSDFMILGGWKLPKEKLPSSSSSFLMPVIPFPTFLDVYFAYYAKSYKEIISAATEDAKEVTPAELKKMEFFARLAWRTNTELGYSCQMRFEEGYWRFVLVMFVNDQSGKPHPDSATEKTVGVYKANIKKFW